MIDLVKLMEKQNINKIINLFNYYYTNESLN